MRRYLVLEKAHITSGHLALITPREVRVHIGMTPLTPEGPLLQEVDLRHTACLFSVVVGRWGGKGLYCGAEGNATLRLHLLISRSRVGCRPKEPGSSLALIVGHKGDMGRRRELS
jgi:hypothetical protein